MLQLKHSSFQLLLPLPPNGLNFCLASPNLNVCPSMEGNSPSRSDSSSPRPCTRRNAGLTRTAVTFIESKCRSWRDIPASKGWDGGTKGLKSRLCVPASWQSEPGSWRCHRYTTPASSRSSQTPLLSRLLLCPPLCLCLVSHPASHKSLDILFFVKCHWTTQTSFLLLDTHISYLTKKKPSIFEKKMSIDV